MKKILVLTALAGLSLGACTEGDPPDAELPVAPPVQALPPSACNFRTAQMLARDYFGTNSLRQQAGDLLRSAERATAGSLTRNNFLFDLFRLIEQARLANQAVDFSAGARLVDMEANCGSFFVSDTRAFVATLTDALIFGAFAYRDGTTSGFLATEPGDAAANPADGNWVGFVGSRAMVFLAQVNQSLQENMPFPGIAFRLGIICDASPPATGTDSDCSTATNDDALVVELCPSTPVGPPPAQWRVGRLASNNAAQAVLQAGNIAGFCGTNPSAPASTGIAQALHRVFEFFTPARLQALMLPPPGIGGSGGGTSDYAVVNALSVNPAFCGPTSTECSAQPPYPIPNGNVGVPFAVVVRYTAAQGTPLENVTATIAIAGNQGVPAGAFLTAHVPSACGLVWSGEVALTVHTDEAGEAKFCVSTNKPGGYTLGVTGAFVGFADVPILTNSFIVQQ